MDSAITGQFIKARQEITTVISKFPPKKRLLPLFDKWTLKDVIAHLSGWDLFTLEAIKALKAGKVPVRGPSINEFNKRSVSKREDWAWNKIYEEFTGLGSQLTLELSNVPESLWGKKIWPNRGLTLEKLLKVDIDHYLNDHLREIEKKSAQ